MDTRERLTQIIECGLPIKTRVGNTLPTDKHNKNLDVFGILEGDIPEVKVLGGDVFQYINEYFYDIKKNYAKALSKASGSKLSPESFIIRSRLDKRKKVISSKSVEIHAFYEPKTNYTYYFPLPAKNLLGLK